MARQRVAVRALCQALVRSSSGTIGSIRTHVRRETEAAFSNALQLSLPSGNIDSGFRIETGRTLINLKDVLGQFVAARECLETFGIRDTGCYAEVLAAKALNGERNLSGVEKGYEVVAPKYGRIEVRSRTLPRNGARETRIQVEDQKWGHFAWLLGIIFEPTLSVHAAYMLPHDAARALAKSGKYPRLPLETALGHPECVNVTTLLKAVEETL